MLTNKIYLNLTNKCNLECSFCSMCSSPNNWYFLPFKKYKKILTKQINKINHEDRLIVQFEGGEPLLHPHLYLFIEYLKFIKEEMATEIQLVIDTNGILLEKHLQSLIQTITRIKLDTTIKISINTEIPYLDKHIAFCKDVYDATEFIKLFHIKFNVRFKNTEDWNLLHTKLLNSNISDDMYVPYQFNAYGRASKNTEYPPITISDTYNEWSCFACDGKNFKTDLIARSDYEKLLSVIQRVINQTIHEDKL